MTAATSPGPGSDENKSESFAARGQLGPDFHQRDEDNIDASREQAAARIPPGVKGINVVQEEGPVGGVPEAGGLPAASSDAYTVFWNGGQYVVQGRDRDHAKRILYVTIPEAKWNEIR